MDDDLKSRIGMSAEEFAKRLDLDKLKAQRDATDAKIASGEEKGLARLRERLAKEGLTKPQPKMTGGGGKGAGGGSGATGFDELFSKGGKVSSASKRADGIAQRGKTRGKMV